MNNMSHQKKRECIRQLKGLLGFWTVVYLTSPIGSEENYYAVTRLAEIKDELKNYGVPELKLFELLKDSYRDFYATWDELSNEDSRIPVRTFADKPPYCFASAGLPKHIHIDNGPLSRVGAVHV